MKKSSFNKFYRLREMQQNVPQLNVSPSGDAGVADITKIIKKLSIKIGEKSNEYIPLIRYNSRNPKMLSLLEKLIEETTMLQASVGKNIYK